MAVDIHELRALTPPSSMPFKIQRLGHVVLQVSTLDRSMRFYTQILGFKVSDVYPEDVQPEGLPFCGCNADHHAIAPAGTGPGDSKHAELHHIAFEVGDARRGVPGARLREHNVTITFEGRRRAGCQIAVEFLDPDKHTIEVYWGLDQVGTDGYMRPASEWKGVKTLEAAIADPVIG